MIVSQVGLNTVSTAMTALDAGTELIALKMINTLIGRICTNSPFWVVPAHETAWSELVSCQAGRTNHQKDVPISYTLLLSPYVSAKAAGGGALMNGGPSRCYPR